MIVCPCAATVGPDLASVTSGDDMTVCTALLPAVTVWSLAMYPTFSIMSPSCTKSLTVTLKVTVPLIPGASVPSVQVMALLAGSQTPPSEAELKVTCWMGTTSRSTTLAAVIASLLLM